MRSPGRSAGQPPRGISGGRCWPVGACACERGLPVSDSRQPFSPSAQLHIAPTVEYRTINAPPPREQIGAGPRGPVARAAPPRGAFLFLAPACLNYVVSFLAIKRHSL